MSGAGYKSTGTLPICCSGWSVKIVPYKEIYRSDILLRKCGKALPVYVFWFPKCDFPGDPWIHFCNGYLEGCLFFNSWDNILLKIIAELLDFAMCLFRTPVIISN